MAKLDTQGLDGVAAYMLQQDAATLKVVPEMLRAGGEVIKAAQEEEIAANFSSKRSTGALRSSIKISEVKETADGKKVEIYPDGKDKHGVRNATKGFVLQYGRSNMPPKPWFTAAMNKGSDKAIDAMRKVWEGRNDS